MKIKQLTLSISLATTIFASQYSAPVMATPATDLGVKIGEKVASLILGEIFSSIFAGADPAATPAQVQNIVNNGFNQAALNEIGTKLNTVLGAISDYNYDADYEVNLTTVENIRNAAQNLQADVRTNMSNDNFMVLAKAYIVATNVRLAFLSERRRYYQQKGIADLKTGETTQQQLDTIIDSENKIIAAAAFESLTDMATMFYQHFYDKTPSTQGCLYKYPITPWVESNGQLGENFDINGVDRSTVTCRHYDPIAPEGTKLVKSNWGTMTSFNRLLIYTAIFPGKQVPFNSTDVMEVHKNDLWAFSIKKYADLTGPFGNDFHMMVVKGEDLARYTRNLNLVTKYPNEIGDVESQVISWLDIIASAKDEDKLQYGMRKATQIGVLQSKMTERYSAKHANVVAAHKQWFSSKLQGWGLAADHAPTRIQFSTTDHYPTDAPAWLADAMN
ncbi:hypothetical protein NI389_02785 [Pseudoalteromonas xiamenensis]|uniref:hypothetical protein n=1 Tax=Pseudoalteromonas xiamenensis TaxID=882626 RepID=UPI0027E3BDA2|nr:hypothetical protein [Pseudoalteromonas xiamenensis]WMN60356.1 hypothetical protein NI389_02785 [Pseudoalteromonas xiamenensis]